jgi:hypothetical protein
MHSFLFSRHRPRLTWHRRVLRMYVFLNLYSTAGYAAVCSATLPFPLGMVFAGQIPICCVAPLDLKRAHARNNRLLCSGRRQTCRSLLFTPASFLSKMFISKTKRWAAMLDCFLAGRVLMRRSALIQISQCMHTLNSFLLVSQL